MTVWYHKKQRHPYKYIEGVPSDEMVLISGQNLECIRQEHSFRSVVRACSLSLDTTQRSKIVYFVKTEASARVARTLEDGSVMEGLVPQHKGYEGLSIDVICLH